MKNSTKKLFLFFALFLSTIAGFAQTADFSMDPATGCNPLVVSFKDKSTGSIASYYWEFGNTITSTLPNPSTTYLAAGTYTVKLTVKSSSGTTSIKTATVIVYPSPTVSYTATPTKACPCDLVTFTNTSVPNAPGAYTSIWSFGDGNTAITNNTTHVYCTPGSYNIALKVTNSAGCVTTKLDTAKIFVNAKPEVDFTATKVSLCRVPDTTYFTSTPTGGKAPYTFSWDFGDGIGSSTASSPRYIYTAVGSYTVRLIITDANGCKDTMTKVGYINVALMNSNFKVPANSCPGTSLIMFENSSTPTPKTTIWGWSDGGTSTGLNPQRYFWKGGTYTITMIDSFGPGCKDTAIKNYIVYPKPKPNFSYTPIYPCPAPATITFNNLSKISDSFLWVFGDGTTSKLKDPVHTYTKDSIYTVWLVAKTSFGCLDTFRVRDTMKDFPLGYPVKRGSTFALPTYDSANSPIIIRVHKGDVDIAIDSAGGCLPFVITPVATMCGRSLLPAADDPVFPCPVPSGYTYPPYWVCGFDGHPTDKYADDFADPYILATKTSCGSNPHPYPIKNYYWDFGDGFTTTVDSPTHTYYTEGSWWVKVTVETHNGCTYKDSVFVTAGNKPLADFTAAPRDICIHDSVYFVNKSSGSTVYVFTFGDGETLTTADSTYKFKHRFDHSDTFTTVLVANRLGCLDTMGIDIIVHPPEAREKIKYFCNAPFDVEFTDTSIGATSLLWRFGDGGTSTAKTVKHTYAAEGKYRMWHIVYNSTFNCADSIAYDIDIFLPKPWFYTPDTTKCIGDSITFFDSSRYYFTNWEWYTASYFQRDTPNHFHVKGRPDGGFGYTDTGRYDVMYIGLDIHGCRDTFTRKKYILVSKPQMKVVASPLIACAPSIIDFTDSSSNVYGAFNVSRKWMWGDATSSSDTAAIKAKHGYTTPGTYNVKVITTDNIGCKDSMTISIEARRPVADFVAVLDTFTCLYRLNKFGSRSSGAGLTYKWYFGDGATSTLPDPEHAYSTIGSFDVKLVVTDETGCKDSITKIAFVKTVKPKASFTMSDSVALCPPLFVTFTNTSTGAVRYTWDFDEGYAAIPSPVAPFIDSGVYIISMVAYDKYGCTDTAYSRVRVLGYDGALKYTPLSGCAPLTVSFEADLVKANVMVWDFADGVTESAVGKLTTSHTYNEPGSYIPRLILGDGMGCSTSSRGLDTIRVDAAVAVVKMTPTCINTPITFTDSSYSYFSAYASSEWIFEDATTASGKTTKRTYSKEGTYTITLITTNTNGCKDTIQKTFTVFGLPVIKAKDTVICLNDQATLSASGGVSYYWNPAPTLSCSDCNNPVTSTKVPVKYIVTGTDERGCTNKDTLDVGIKIKTTLLHTADTEICERDPIQLLASGAHNYYWSPATFLSADNIPNPVATMDSTIIYRVIGTEGSCIPDTAMIKVTVHPLPEVDAGADQKVLAGTEVQLSGNGKYIKDYLWSPAATLSCASCQNPVAKPLTTTIYTLKGTSDFGCSDSDKVQITIFCDQSQLYIPNTFTPNGDGLNDYFYPQGKGVGKIKAFTIFNRWGQKVFEKTAFDANTKEQGWDGTFNGDALSPDTFVYTLEATCDNGEIVFIKGDVTIIK
ncbi:MAG: PKD domain-containing protein [Chitinophagaceae bacterium]|jgi:gliding motility-associated-like protein